MQFFEPFLCSYPNAVTFNQPIRQTENGSQFETEERPRDVRSRSQLCLQDRWDKDSRPVKLTLQLDHVCFIVDPHGAELVQDVLPQQTVKGDLKALREFFQVHHGNRL